MRFITDGMLGKLTRWLRLMGHDVTYLNDATDKQLMERAKLEGRVLLTGDVELYRRSMRSGIKAFLVKGRDQVEQLATLAKRFNLKLEIDSETSRCPICNSEIKPISKDLVKDRVPVNTFMRHNEFWICTNCSQIFWRGSHWKKINDTLKRAQNMLYQSKS